MSAVLLFLRSPLGQMLVGGVAALGILTSAGEGIGLAVQHFELDAAHKAEQSASTEAAAARAAVAQLQHDSDARAKDAAAAVAAAASAAQGHQQAAKVILQAAPSNPNDLCASSSELIREQITKDRQP